MIAFVLALALLQQPVKGTITEISHFGVEYHPGQTVEMDYGDVLPPGTYNVTVVDENGHAIIVKGASVKGIVIDGHVKSELSFKCPDAVSGFYQVADMENEIHKYGTSIDGKIGFYIAR